MSEQHPTVGICIISTLKYKQFVKPLVDSINRYFLPCSDLHIHLFTDEHIEPINYDRITFHQWRIEPYRFPLATLYRYKIFCNHSVILKQDYTFYLDADMLINDLVSTEILNPITVVHHPGFYKNNGWGSPNVDERSTAYIEPEKRKEYVAGGFNGGETKEFMRICQILSHNISIDEENGVIAEHNDESHLNHLISTMEDRNKVTILSPSYVMPEQEHLQKAWGIYGLPKKILALEKQHELIRN